MDLASLLGNLGVSLGVVIGIAILALVTVSAVRYAIGRYKVVDQHTALVISGRKGARVVIGGGAFVWPIVETWETVDMNVITITQEADQVYDTDGLKLLLDWVATLQVQSTAEAVIAANRAFEGLSDGQKSATITKVITSSLRAICGQLDVMTIHNDRETFTAKVQDLARAEMLDMGLRIITIGLEDMDAAETDQVGEDGKPLQTFFEALSAPKIAKVRKDAKIAEAINDREGRVKAAEEKLIADQAEVSANTKILEQNEALALRQVAKDEKVDLATQEKNEKIAAKRATANEKAQEADVLVPARAQADAKKIIAEGERQKLEVEAEGVAKSAEVKARGTSQATKLTADATAQATRQTGLADAASTEAKLLAQAKGTEAQLFAEAKGKLELAKASASQNAINLQEVLARALIEAEVKIGMARAQALGSMGSNIRIVQFAGSGQGHTGNVLLDTLSSVPEFGAMLDAKSQALTGLSLEELMARVITLLKTGEAIHVSEPEAPAESMVEEPAAPLTEEPSSAPAESMVEEPAAPLTEEPSSAPVEEPAATEAPVDDKKQQGRGQRRTK